MWLDCLNDSSLFFFIIFDNYWNLIIIVLTCTYSEFRLLLELFYNVIAQVPLSVFHCILFFFQNLKSRLSRFFHIKYIYLMALIARSLLASRADSKKNVRREGEIILLILYFILEIKVMRWAITIKIKVLFYVSVISKNEH